MAGYFVCQVWNAVATQRCWTCCLCQVFLCVCVCAAATQRCWTRCLCQFFCAAATQRYWTRWRCQYLVQRNRAVLNSLAAYVEALFSHFPCPDLSEAGQWKRFLCGNETHFVRRKDWTSGAPNWVRPVIRFLCGNKTHIVRRKDRSFKRQWLLICAWYYSQFFQLEPGKCPEALGLQSGYLPLFRCVKFYSEIVLRLSFRSDQSAAGLTTFKVAHFLLDSIIPLPPPPPRNTHHHHYRYHHKHRQQQQQQQQYYNGHPAVIIGPLRNTFYFLRLITSSRCGNADSETD